jgi:hypothetical protein
VALGPLILIGHYWILEYRHLGLEIALDLPIGHILDFDTWTSAKELSALFVYTLDFVELRLYFASRATQLRRNL